MKLSDLFLTKLEEQRHLLIVQSTFPEIAYAVDHKNGAMWVINRQTGQELQIAVENVNSFAYELMDVAMAHLQKQNLFMRGAG